MLPLDDDESKNDHTNEGMDDFLAQKAWVLNL